MLDGNDMVGFVRKPSIFFVQQTVFAASLCPRAHQGAESSGNEVCHFGVSFFVRSRALTNPKSVSANSN
jgi:hypothetical protein